VAHEINNPLSFVASHLDTVRANLDKLFAPSGAPEAPNAEERRARVRTRLTDMKLGLERIRDLVLKLRTFSRLDEGHRQHASVSECIDSVLTILRHRIPEGVVVETSYGEPDVIDCFPALLNQALLNVTANAVDAMTGPGTLRITAGADGGTYVIAVADEGAGIPDHLRERVLEPFFTTKPVGQGTGLGLSITYSIVKKHGGSIELMSNQPSGTTVAIRLPLAPTASSNLEPTPCS
jgi:two-component system NtrC family sensor kinase